MLELKYTDSLAHCTTKPTTSSWVSATHVRDPDGDLGFWLWFSPTLAVLTPGESSSRLENAFCVYLLNKQTLKFSYFSNN